MRCVWVVLLFPALILLVAGCGGGSSTPPPPTTVSISPTSAIVATGATQQFSASVSGTTNSAVDWTVPAGAAGGTITAGGLYTAPGLAPNPGQVTVMARSQADPTKTGLALVTVTGIGMQVLPQAVTLQVNRTQQFSASVTGTTNTAVTWSVLGGNTNGTISPSGFYIAPATVPNPAQVTVQATSQADATKFQTATVTVIAAVLSITVNPNATSVAPYTTQQFYAAATNLSSNAVTWQVNGVTGGTQAFGYISSSGLYIAPGGVPTTSTGAGKVEPTTVSVTAVSQVNPSVTGSATVTVFPANQNPQANPIQLGTSGGNQKNQQRSGNYIYCCSGTLGSAVQRGGTLYVLSNNHVLAMSDQGTVTSGPTLGDNITQPGLIDTSCGQGGFTIIANLSQFYNLETGPGPKIDAAIALPVANGVDPSGKILYLGGTTDGNNVPLADAPHGGSGLAATSSLVGRGVAKSGRTTGLTCANVISISTISSVQYQKGCHTGTTFGLTFTNQIAVGGGSFSAPGDSGSLIVTQDTADPVALLFAGSDQETIGNPVGDVLSYFASGGTPMTFAGGAAHPVIGCTLPAVPASAVLAVPLSGVTGQAMQKAIAVRDAHGSELMAQPEVQAVGVGASQDRLGEPAIVFFVTKGQPRTGIPQVVDGIGTRIVEGELFARQGLLTAKQSAEMEQAREAAANSYGISEAEFARAKTVHTARGEEWMSKAWVQGIGIGASLDSPGEAALVVFTIRGTAHEAVPPVIDGMRTRVRESSRFIAGLDETKNTGRGCKAPANGLRPK